MTADAKALKEALSAFFPPERVHWKPQSVSGSRALAVAYIDARDVQDRLDEVLGVDGWQDEYDFLAGGCVACRLRLRFGSEWVTKMDVGGPSDQKDPGDRAKAAVSDALKRAASKVGVGRYLYRLPSSWCDYDPQRKQFVRPPQLPAWALPGGTRTAPPRPAEAERAHEPRPTAETPQKPTPAKPSRPEWAIDLTKALNEHGIPAADLLERYQIKRLGELPPEHHRDALQWVKSRTPEPATFDRWLRQKAARLEKDGKATPEALTEFVVACARRAGETRDPLEWGPESLQLGIRSVNEFVDLHYAPPVPQPAT